MGSRIGLLTVLVLIAPLCWGQASDRMSRDPNTMTVIGPRNLPLYDGAQELLAGNDAEGGGLPSSIPIIAAARAAA